VNLAYQNAGIEDFIRQLHDSADSEVRLRLRTTTTTHPNSLRLATITYRLSATRGHGRFRELFEITLDISNDRNNPKVRLTEPVVLGDWSDVLGSTTSSGSAAARPGRAVSEQSGGEEKRVAGHPAEAEAEEAEIYARLVGEAVPADVESPLQGRGPAAAAGFNVAILGVTGVAEIAKYFTEKEEQEKLNHALSIEESKINLHRHEFPTDGALVTIFYSQWSDPNSPFSGATRFRGVEVFYGETEAEALKAFDREGHLSGSHGTWDVRSYSRVWVPPATSGPSQTGLR
jgi:hypothetical protein